MIQIRLLLSDTHSSLRHVVSRPQHRLKQEHVVATLRDGDAIDLDRDGP